MGRWGLSDPEMLAALDNDPELVRMFELRAAEEGVTPHELLARLVRNEFETALDQAFDEPPDSRARRIFAKVLGEGEPLFDLDEELIDGS